MKTSKCRSCKTVKAVGDPCPSCGAGLAHHMMRVRKGKPVSLAKAHFFHAVTAGVSVAIAKGDYGI